MSKDLYSINEVADLLGLHVKTVRNYVASGRLPATRIGKQYRIARADLEHFTGKPVTSGSVELVAETEVSSIVQLDGLGEAAANRLSNLLVSAARGHREEAPLRVETLFEPERNRMRVIVIGSIESTVTVLQMIDLMNEG